MLFLVTMMLSELLNLIVAKMADAVIEANQGEEMVAEEASLKQKQNN